MELMKGLLDKGYRLAVDHHFNSPELCLSLYDRKTHCLGMVCGNRRGMPKDLHMKLDGTSLQKGEVTYRTTDKLMALCWRDRNYVTMLSNCNDASMVDTGKKTNEGQPIHKAQVIGDYNAIMGGVDRSNQLLKYYSFLWKAIKWVDRIEAKMEELEDRNWHNNLHLVDLDEGSEALKIIHGSQADLFQIRLRRRTSLTRLTSPDLLSLAVHLTCPCSAEEMESDEADMSLVNSSVDANTKAIFLSNSRVDRIEAKMEELEDRNWHNNLHLVDLDEGSEGENAIDFLTKALPRWFPSLMGKSIEIMRAHRIYTDKSRMTDKPLTHFLIFSTIQTASSYFRLLGRLSSSYWEGPQILPRLQQLHNPAQTGLFTADESSSFPGFAGLSVISLSSEDHSWLASRSVSDPTEAQDFLNSIDISGSS
ncbi:UNVERIFIED_CONTAM: hypothetical protein FKN15_048766 [Acipenser sinensis]